MYHRINLISLHPLRILLFAAVMAVSVFPSVTAQNNDTGVYIDPTKSDRDFRTRLNMAGNNVETIINNFGTIGSGNASINQAGVWPRGTGHGHLHEMTGWVTSRVDLPGGGRQVIVSNGYGDSQSNVQDPETGVEWKFHPKPGYYDPTIDNPRIANQLDPNTWPDSWPGKDATWDGQWNGFFGLNQFSADQEAYYVMDDYWNRKFPFYPNANDSSKRGLGMQVSVRLFQWSQALANNILFMFYEVSNTGTTSYSFNMNDNPIFFGGYTDVNPSGAGATDDAAAFNRMENIVYGWSATGVGLWNQFREIPPGYIGWKFLQSPGISTDGIDNDGDLLIDESQESPAGEYVFGPCGIYDDPQFRWEGDENCNWNPLTDDVGSDGIGPLDPNWPGPDPDGTEGNGKPDQGEPNFGRLDNAESDQIGLTSFFAPLFGTVLISDEESMWNRMQPGFFDIPQQAVNQYWIFGSGPFELLPGQTERFSTCFVFGANENEMFRNAQVAQRIYDADYRFARPPLPPRLQAIPGDGKVVLVWDEVAEFSFDPIYGFDFEGYRVIKATDPRFRDAKDITDALGTPRFKVSIAQYDLINDLTGPHPLQLGEEIGAPTGIHYYMGDDTGLRHYYIDEDVINGREYYYAVVSYDHGYYDDFFERGISEIENSFNISPSESPASITLENGVITRFDPNTASARPNTQPTDVDEGRIDTDSQNRITRAEGFTTGQVQAITVARDLLKDLTYELTFEQEGTKTSVEYATSTYSLTDSEGNILIDREPVPRTLANVYSNNWTHELLDEGFVLIFNNRQPTLSNTQITSGWTSDSKTNLRTSIELFPYSPPIIWPINVVIEVFDPTGEPVDSSFRTTTGRVKDPVWFKVYEEGSEENVNFIFNSQGTTPGVIDTTNSINLVFRDRPTDTRYTYSWTIRFLAPTRADGTPLPPDQVIPPQPGDKFILRAEVPFGERDKFVFRTSSTQPSEESGKDLLDKIRVVPNPYVAATITESRPFLSGRGERRIEFRNLPARSKIRIYTASGVFVRQIETDMGVAVWNLRTKDDLEAAFGLYFYHVEAEGIGEKVGKFAIIN